MKKVFISVALLSVLATMAISCQKEETNNLYPNAEAFNAVRVVRYAINGKEYSIAIYGENQWQEFVNRMITLAREGNEVRFANENTPSTGIADKDVHVLIVVNVVHEGDDAAVTPFRDGEARLLPHFTQHAVLGAFPFLEFTAHAKPFVVVEVVFLLGTVQHEVLAAALQIT